jgi:hypothetical protein
MLMLMLLLQQMYFLPVPQHHPVTSTHLGPFASHQSLCSDALQHRTEQPHLPLLQ